MALLTSLVYYAIFTASNHQNWYFLVWFSCAGGWSHISASKRTVLWSFLSLFHPEPDTSWGTDDHFRRTEQNVSHQLICAFLLNHKADMSLLKPESSPCVYYRRVLLLPGSLSILQHFSCISVASFHSFSAGVSLKIHFSISFNKQSVQPFTAVGEDPSGDR